MKWNALLLLLSLVCATSAQAQVVDLANPASAQIVNGTIAGARGGSWMDVGDLNGDLSNKDLIIGSPDAGSSRGEVRVLFGWVSRTGTFTFDQFNITITGAAAGDRFGTATNAGFVLTQEIRPWPTTSRDLVVGAPGASGGRGEVYLFPGPLGEGSMDTSDATARIIGAPGDQLGRALETADLNNDGFREIVIGAPGNARVYVVDYHNFPAGTLDLSTPQPGVTVISGPGIGYVLASGDVTADGIFDLAIGAPTVGFSAGAVYVIKGRGSALPAVLGIPANADTTFHGLDSGDNLGGAIWIRDVDGDDTWDLVTTALDADGPANSRPDAGEAYVVFGRAALPATVTADATIYGAAAGHRLGYHLWIGSINRDEPDDIALLARGANGGSGEGYVVYGRSRAAFATPIDLATSADRRIVSDETQGAIERMVVFEVTGEGAEDIALGVPDAEGAAGRVYFALSPTLTASAQGRSGTQITIDLIVNPEQVLSYPIRLDNRTEIPVSWEAGTTTPWLSVSRASGATTASSAGIFDLVIDARGLASGFYQGFARVEATGNLETSVGVTLNLQVAAANRDPGDFSGDGRFDLIWQHQGNGAMALWRMNGLSLHSGDPLNPGTIADLDWKIAATGDFNGDGHPDLIFQHQTQGWLAAWLMNGPNQVAGVALSPDRVADTDWKIVATGDFDLDGKRDLVWQHLTDGRLAVWLMDGLTLKSGVSLTPDRVADLNWRVVGAGDFNGDGRQDLAWQHQTSGDLAVWFLSGTTMLRGDLLTPSTVPDTTWKVRAVGDINGDGKPDLIWQNTGSGALSAWLMNGTTQVSGTSLTPGTVADLNWKIVGAK